MTSTYTRRDILKRGSIAAAAGFALPAFGRVGPAFGLTEPDPSTALRNRLVVIYLGGGNDGLNTVVPTSGVRRDVYDKVRPTIGYAPGDVLPLDLTADDADRSLGLNPTLPLLYDRYKEGRVALLQGVDYPDHNYSHFASRDIWQSGLPGSSNQSGWLGRHLDRVGIGEGELRGLAISKDLPLIMRGRDEGGVNINKIPVRFRDGNQSSAGVIARHDAARTFASWPTTDTYRHVAGVNAAGTVDLVEQMAAEEPPPKTNVKIADALLTARVLLEGNYGCEVVHVRMSGFDTHAQQRTGQEKLLGELDYGIDTFLNGDSSKEVAPMSDELASRTLIMTYSEFGRRIGQNGSQGTDHGAAAPLFLLGPAGGSLVGGIHTDHPEMGTLDLPEDNLKMTTDVRSVYQTVLTDWLNDPETDPSYPTEPIPAVFA